MKTKWLSVLVATVTLAVGYQSLHYWNSDRIDFNTQVKPLLNRKCIACHGGVKRAGEFSLLFRQDAVGTKGKSGKIAIVPGDASHSEVIRRITSHDPEERMPKKEEPLSSAEIELLTNWIDQGAEWGDHWAYTPLHEVKVPKSGLLAGFFDWIWGNKASEWAKNDVDFFVWDKLQANGLKPSVEAEGSLEVMPEIGAADIICDLVETGTTLQQNRLRMLTDGVILNTQSVLIANQQSLQREPIMRTAELLLEHIEAHLRAQGYVMIVANVRGASFEAVGTHGR